MIDIYVVSSKIMETKFSPMFVVVYLVVVLIFIEFDFIFVPKSTLYHKIFGNTGSCVCGGGGGSNSNKNK